MSVRAKFQLIKTTQTMHSVRDAEGKYNTVPLTSMAFQVVHGNTPENEKFFASTPSGTIELGVINPEAAQQFELGKEYYIDFTPAEQSADK